MVSAILHLTEQDGTILPPRRVKILGPNGVEPQCVYDVTWVLAEVEQEGGYRVISRPVPEDES